MNLDKELSNCPGHGQSKDETTQRIMIWKHNYDLKLDCSQNGLKVKVRNREDRLPL